MNCHSHFQTGICSPNTAKICQNITQYLAEKCLRVYKYLCNNDNTMWHCAMIVTVCLHFRKLQAFIDEYPFLQYYLSKQRSCILKVTREPIAQSGFAVVVKKGSPWKSHLSDHILKYKGEGTIEKLDKKWVAKVCTEKSDILPGKVPSSYFGGLIITLAIFVSVSLTILIFEHIYQRYHCKMGTARKVTPGKTDSQCQTDWSIDYVLHKT